MQRLLIFIVKCYQVLISPLLGKRCRYYPSCSAFMIEAIEKLGPIKGLLTGIKRILKCHPFHEGGYDPLQKWIK